MAAKWWPDDPDNLLFQGLKGHLAFGHGLQGVTQ
jgi:hypothetical protein